MTTIDLYRLRSLYLATGVSYIPRLEGLLIEVIASINCRQCETIN
ncbi:hypothetical protein [Chlorogloea sp. CCALA 695]|nr:hypothetical protein [Chlorogloea sp. CCALA 695]